MTNRRTSLYTIRLTEAGPEATALLDRLQAGLNEQGYAVADYGSTTLSFRTTDDATALAVAGQASGQIPTSLSTGMGVHRREVLAPEVQEEVDQEIARMEARDSRSEAPTDDTEAITELLQGDPWSGPFLVQVDYNTEADGTPVPEDLEQEARPLTLHGPFSTEAEAMAWIEDYPDGDTDVDEMTVVPFDRSYPVINPVAGA